MNRMRKEFGLEIGQQIDRKNGKIFQKLNEKEFYDERKTQIKDQYPVDELASLIGNTFISTNQKCISVYKRGVDITLWHESNGITVLRGLILLILQVDFFNKNTTTTYYDECPLEGHLIVKDLLIVCFAIAVSYKSTNFAQRSQKRIKY